MNGICYIAGASGEDFNNFELKNEDLLIASDGGYTQLIKKGYNPDVLIGDLDSLNNTIPNDIKVIKHPVMKDDTDTMLCIKYGIEKGYRKFVIFGGMGGRLSHTYANIQSLAYLTESGYECRLSSQSSDVYMIKNGKIVFDECSSGHISVFSYSETSYGVCESGLKYTVENAVLTNKFPLGVSNSFIGKPAEISVKDGVLLIITEREE